MLAQLLDALNTKEPLTLAKLAEAAKTTEAEVLKALHCECEAWWYIEQVPGSKGWLYRKRDLASGYVPNVMLPGGRGEA
jgi:hypothetical protein